MEYNDKIMLAVFEKFLENPAELYRLASLCEKNSQDSGKSVTNWVDFYCPSVSGYERNLVRWHVAIFLSEFVLDRRWVVDYSSLLPLKGEDYLTYSGKALLAKLKKGTED